MRLASISVDLDEIPNYFEIHGLPRPSGPEATLVYDVALARLRALAAALRFPLTLFTIGSDLARAEACAGLREAAGEGHEIANHSLDHRYDLVRLGRDEIARQIGEGARVIETATGQAPVGFRAPGYTISAPVFEVLADLGVEPDARGVAVAVDGEVIPQGEWPAFTVAAGSRVEAVTAVQGG